MSEKAKKLSPESKTGDKPRYEAPRFLPLGRTGAAEGGTDPGCNPGSGNAGGCGTGNTASTACTEGNSAGSCVSGVSAETCSVGNAGT